MTGTRLPRRLLAVVLAAAALMAGLEAPGAAAQRSPAQAKNLRELVRTRAGRDRLNKAIAEEAAAAAAASARLREAGVSQRMVGRRNTTREVHFPSVVAERINDLLVGHELPSGGGHVNLTTRYLGEYELSWNHSAMARVLHEAVMSTRAAAKTSKDTSSSSASLSSSAVGESGDTDEVPRLLAVELRHHNGRDVDLGAEYVTGLASLRRGNAKSDLLLEGAFFPHTGHLFLVAHPYGWPSNVADFVGARDEPLDEYVRVVAALRVQHPAVVDAMRARQKRGVEELVRVWRVHPQVLGMPHCQFKVFARVTQVPDEDAKEGAADDDLASSSFATSPSMLNELDGVMYSPRCDSFLYFHASAAETAKILREVGTYTILATMVFLVQVVVIMAQTKYSGTSAAVAKVNPYTIGLQAILDSYLTWLHVASAIKIPTYFNAFAVATALKFILFSGCELKYLVSIFKARDPTGASDPGGVRVFAKFWMAMSAGLIVMFYAQKVAFLLVLGVLGLYSFWIPQIIDNITMDVAAPMLPRYVWGTALARLFVPVYFLVYKHNYLGTTPQPQLAMLVVAVQLGQAGILQLQMWRGARWFVPQSVIAHLPQRYDYHRPRPAATLEDGNTDCVICQSNVEADDTHMITPCDHVFHQECLQDWLTIKLECPTCRAQLPIP